MAAVCHGPGALTEAELNGKPLVKGKKVMQLASSDLFYLRYPNHPLSREMQAVAQQIMV